MADDSKLPDPFFDSALHYVLENEGGYSNNPADKGGPTNWGITQADLSAYLGRKASADDVKAMTRDVAAAIYKANYWLPLVCNKCPSEALATMIFDQGGVRGVGSAQKLLKAIVGIPDNVSYSTAWDILNSRKVGTPDIYKRIALAFAKQSLAPYIRICTANPSQLVFLSGWSTRVLRLFDLVFWRST